MPSFQSSNHLADHPVGAEEVFFNASQLFLTDIDFQFSLRSDLPILTLTDSDFLKNRKREKILAAEVFVEIN